MNSVNQPPHNGAARHPTTGRLRLLVLPVLVAALIVPAAGAGASDDLELVGEVTIEHADDFSGGRSEEYVTLQTERGRFLVHGPKARALRPGSVVRIRGKRQGDAVVLGADSSVTTLAEPSSTLGPTSASGATIQQRVAVLLINFTSPTASPDPSASPSSTPTPPAEPWTRAAVRGLYFTNQKSVASYFAEVSDGQMSVTGDVFGYFTVAASTAKCDYSAWGLAARDAAKAAGINLSSYTNVVHAWPKQSSCWWGGLGQLPGRFSWINGSMTLYVTSHELGHNFGAHHASTMTCTKSGTRVPLSSSCTLDEYGDPFDVMGTSAQRHLQGFHRRQLGFFSSDNQLTVTANGRYTVATAQLAGPGPRLLRIRRSSSEYFYLEFRQPFGLYDNFSTTAAAVNGVMVRIAPDVKRLQSQLIDMNPQTTTFNDAPLAVGQTFTDGSLSITTVSISPSGATLRIQLGPDTVAPSSPGSLTATAMTDDSVRLAWTASTDDLEVTGYRVSRDGQALTTLSDTSWTDTDVAQGRTYSYSVEALDAAQNRSAPAQVTHHVPDTVAPGAPTAPTAALTGPRSVSLEWQAASDNVGVVAYSVMRNGSPWTTTETTSAADSSLMDGFTYDYLVRAADAAGNVGPAASVSISLPDVTPPTAPASLSLTASSATGTQVTWQAATDNVAVAGYRVRRDGVTVATLAASASSFSEGGLASDRTYTYGLAALDGAGNVGPELTAAVKLTSVDTTPPTVPQALATQALGYRRVSLSWKASTDNSGGPLTYRVFRNGTRVATVTTTNFVDRPATAGTYKYKVRAVDPSGNKSAFTPVVLGDSIKGALPSTETILGPDTTPPSVPKNLTGQALERRYVKLTWQASTDDRAGAISYRLFRGTTRVATLTTTSYTDRAPAVGTYTYKVRAVDAAGNKSAFTPKITVRAVKAL